MTPTTPPSAMDVQDPSRVLECSQIERQRSFQHLVRLYLSQVLYGCKSADCQTPTCLSSNTRNASKPHRPPTQLTASALAHYLAGQDNPTRGLCPHELQVAPDSLEIVPRRTHNGESVADAVPGEHHSPEEEEEERVMSAVRQRRQAKKDTKSLGQNLYDSFAMLYFYSKQIPTSASVLASLRPTDRAPHHETELGNGRPVAPRVNDTAPIVRQYSHSDPKSYDNSRAKHSEIELPSNAQQLHKIPYHPRDNTTQTKYPLSSDPIIAFDGTSESPRLSTKRLAIMGRTKPLPVPEGRVGKEDVIVRRATPDLPVIPILSCDLLDKLKQEVSHRRGDHPRDLSSVVDYDKRYPFRPAKPFVNQSLFYTLSDPDTLLKSFHDHNGAFKDSPLPHLDSVRLVPSFQDWNRLNGALVFDSLWVAVEALFTPPPELDVQKSPRLRPSRKGASSDSWSEHSSGSKKDRTAAPRYLSTNEAAHIVMICIHALTSLVPVGWPHTWARLRRLRSWGVIIPDVTPNMNAFTHPFMDIIDELEYEPALRLADRLLRGIGMRTCFEHILASLNYQENEQASSEPVTAGETLVGIIVRHLEVVERVALANQQRLNSKRDVSEDPGWTVTATFMESLRTIIIKKWDGKAEINKWSTVGTAVRVLDKLHSHHQSLNLRLSMFEMPVFNERLANVNEPTRFLTWVEQPNTLHIFQYPSLFPAQYLVAYFRTINFTEMMKQYDLTTRTKQMQKQLPHFLREPYWWIIRSRMKVTLSDYLVLDVSREDALEDALDQLWGLDKRMLLKPLKVKMGHQEGELGLDHGGVTYEFFRVVLGEAFKPDNGMFTIDPETRMTWFQPCSLEPLWKFEMLGILFSLAVYNGITLPVTFPLALYDFLQANGTPPGVRRGVEPLEYISDGWSDLAKGFRDLLSWSEGDVEDIFMREYVFSYEAFGQIINHNMKNAFVHPPSETPGLSTEGGEKSNPQSEPDMVTNENREEYVREYVYNLTYSSVRPQLHAFLNGFQTCINPQSLQFFTPSTLRHLIEGTHHISIPDLRRCAKYEDGYSASHSVIRNFWAVVEQYSQEDCRHLLEFVTASDRVPVTGYESITFDIYRIEGAPEKLPSSSTCFGKLYLPGYPDRETMREKLEVAIRNSKGFGVV
ncbi:ubiquitin-protein ligase E3A [Clathrospora elynae]|uniref:HECT-type E3 ubiquitin transferase n=1 Tax=Clathrospora elynae TaxID=706981 RepID=A0A6A5SNF8_9PLEO|nr:ubiquitin-protein ligase E3A [Clathrospora elynae]